jgi:hypothetical protein
MQGVKTSMSEIEKQEIPTAVTVKPVLGLIAAYTDRDHERFKGYAIDIARELELNNKDELAQYIYAQFGLVPTFEITD